MREPKRARAKVWKTWPVKMLIGMKDLELEERKVNETGFLFFLRVNVTRSARVC